MTLSLLAKDIKSSSIHMLSSRTGTEIRRARLKERKCNHKDHHGRGESCVYGGERAVEIHSVGQREFASGADIYIEAR